MKITAGIIAVVLATATVAVAEQADDPATVAKTISPFVDERTVIVGRVDVGRFDLEAIVGKMAEQLEAKEKGAGKEFKESEEKIKRWKQQFAQAGGKELYFVVRFEEEMGESCYAVLPLAEGADSKVLGNLLRYGSAEERKGTAEEKRLKADWLFGAMETEVIRGALVVGQEEELAKIRVAQSLERPELIKALAAGNQANVQIVVVPNEPLRNTMGMALPNMLEEIGVEADTGTVIEGLLWESLALNGPPKMSLKVVIQAKDEASAKATGDLLTNMFEGIKAKLAELDERERPGIAASLVALTGMFKPVVEKDQATMGLNDEQMNKLIFDILMPSVAEAQKVAMRAVSATKLHQIALGCIMYANDYQGELPANLEALVGIYLPDSMNLVNPRQVELKVGYVYIRPGSLLHESPTQLMLMY